MTLLSHFVHSYYKLLENNTWSQIVIEEEYLLAEIPRTAGLWRSYWLEYSDGGKRRDLTMIKTYEIEAKGDRFNQTYVLAWKLS
jgi:hypothetical protein